MGVDHGGRHIGVSEQLLDSPDILTRFEQVGSETMPEGMAGNFFGDSCASHCRFDCCLHGILVDVMATELLSVFIANMFLCGSLERLSGVRVEGQVPGRKQILPTEFLTGLGPFDCKGVG